MTPIISILMATTPDRNEMFTPLFNELHSQLELMQTFHPSLGDIEIVVDDSKRFLDGGLSIGHKRQALLDRATGKYLLYLDSDDWIAPNYLETVVRLAQYDKDLLTFKNLTKLYNYWMVVDMSLKYTVNEEGRPGMITRRPWHVNGVKRIYAKQHRFKNTSYGEDWSWFERVLSHCQTEEHSDAIIHEYRHGKHSEADKIVQYQKEEYDAQPEP